MESSGSTPIYEALYYSLYNKVNEPVEGRTSIYLFNDGKPDGSIKEIENLVKYRIHPKQTPISLMSCSDIDKEVALLKV
jgi:hypothetical protein